MNVFSLEHLENGSWSLRLVDFVRAEFGQPDADYLRKNLKEYVDRWDWWNEQEKTEAKEETEVPDMVWEFGCGDRKVFMHFRPDDALALLEVLQA